MLFHPAEEDILLDPLPQRPLDGDTALRLCKTVGGHAFDHGLAGAQGVNQRKFEAFWSAHVRPALGFPEEVQLYSLKDTGITNMASAGIPINLVRQQADHSNVAITSIYLGLRRAEAVPELRGAQILPK